MHWLALAAFAGVTLYLWAQVRSLRAALRSHVDVFDSVNVALQSLWKHVLTHSAAPEDVTKLRKGLEELIARLERREYEGVGFTGRTYGGRN